MSGVFEFLTQSAKAEMKRCKLCSRTYDGIFIRKIMLVIFFYVNQGVVAFEIFFIVLAVFFVSYKASRTSEGMWESRKGN